MTPLILALGLTAPAQPPAFPQLPPGVRVQPQVPQPVFRVPPQLPPQAPPAVTLADFSRLFTPTPGKHHVWVVHPCTGQPVAVCFTLPPGRLRRFEVDDRWIEFRFDRCEVRIDFLRNGRVDVDYDD